MSLSARGTLGGSLCFARPLGRQIAKRKPHGVNRKSFPQQYQRARYKACASLWSLLTDDQQAAWTDAARQHQITGWNQFLRTNLTRMIAGLFPYGDLTTHNLNPNTNVEDVNVTSGQHRLTIDTTSTGPTDTPSLVIWTATTTSNDAALTPRTAWTTYRNPTFTPDQTYELLNLPNGLYYVAGLFCGPKSNTFTILQTAGPFPVYGL